MKLLECFIGLGMLSVANSYPVNMICITSCNMEVTAREEFIQEWLDNGSDTGIHQLHISVDMDTVINTLIRNVSTSVS